MSVSKGTMNIPGDEERVVKDLRWKASSEPTN